MSASVVTAGDCLPAESHPASFSSGSLAFAAGDDLLVNLLIVDQVFAFELHVCVHVNHLGLIFGRIELNIASGSGRLVQSGRVNLLVNNSFDHSTALVTHHDILIETPHARWCDFQRDMDQSVAAHDQVTE